jgi:regulator of protease activity HflC (stomatin/prohibitin superfamily)
MENMNIVINNVILEDLYFFFFFKRAVETRMRAEQEMLMAELERERALIQANQQLEIAQKQGEALVIAATADAESLKIMQNAWGELGGEVREAMLRQMFFESWNGILPQVVGGDNLGLIMDGLN